MNKKNLLFRVALALVSIVVTVFLYATHLIYFAQREYFAHYFVELLSLPLIYAVAAVTLVVIFMAMLPRKLLQYISAMLLVLALLCWFQSDMFAVSYGVLDGAGLDFSRFDQRGYWELAVLAVALVLALLFNKLVNKHFVLIVALVVLGQLAITGINVFNEPNDKAPIAEVDDEFFNYSSEKNIILIILDTFGGDIFRKVVAKNPGFVDEFQGFVSYTDATSNYPGTKGSLPSLLTGQMIPQNIRTADYIKNVVGTQGLPAVFRDKGFDVSVISSYTWFRNFFPERYMNEPPVHPGDLKLFNSGVLLDYALFRVAPHVFKEHIYADGNWFLSSQVATHTEVPGTKAEQANLLLEMSADKAVLANENPRFKIIHVLTPHPKFVFNENCEKGLLPEKAPAPFLMEQQSTCALRKLNALLQKYKELGVYDDSLIVVTSDHGARLFNDQSITGFPSYYELNSSGIYFMIKGIGQSGDFRKVNQPFSLIKLFDALLDSNQHTSQYDKMSDNERLFYAYKNNFKGAKGMMQDAPLYEVGANYRKAESWQLKEFVVNDCDYHDMPITMTFNTNKREQYCGVFGIGLAEANGAGAWTESVDSRIVFNANIPDTVDSSHTIKMTFEPNLFADQKEIEMIVQLNNFELVSTVIDQAGEQSLSFDFSTSQLSQTGTQELKILLPGLKTAKQMNAGMGTKLLGVLLKSITLSDET